MSHEEWESLCDGCGKCCLVRLEDDNGDLACTNLSCILLNVNSCECINYDMRHEIVPECMPLTPDNVSEMKWLPKTCAYRLLNEGKELPEWHPLVTGDPESVHLAGVSVKGKVLPENVADPDFLTDYIIDWMD